MAEACTGNSYSNPITQQPGGSSKQQHPMQGRQEVEIPKSKEQEIQANRRQQRTGKKGA